MPDKTQAEIPYAVAEYTATFKKPLVEAWGKSAALVATVLNALQPWGFGIDGLETKNPEKASEAAFIFRRTEPPSPEVRFTVGLGKIVASVENPSWAEAKQVIDGVKAGLEAVLRIGNAELKSHQLGIGMHIQIKTKPRKEVTAHLLSPAAFSLLDGEVQFPGIILMRNKASIVIDGSLAYANGLFVRIVREHPPEASLQHMADVLRKDEEHLFELLGLEGIL